MFCDQLRAKPTKPQYWVQVLHHQILKQLAHHTRKVDSHILLLMGPPPVPTEQYSNDPSYNMGYLSESSRGSR